MKILIADDIALYRDGLKFNLKNLLPNIQIWETASLTETITTLKNNPDIKLVLVDWDMPELNWENFVAGVKKISNDIRIGIISNHDDFHSVKKALSLGSCCYLPKNINSKLLEAALEIVVNGGTYYPPELLEQSNSSLKLNNGKKLTNRQFEVLKYLAQGLSNKQIAYQMKVSEATVKLHINALLRALGATNRTQAIIKAQKIGAI